MEYLEDETEREQGTRKRRRNKITEGLQCHSKFNLYSRQQGVPTQNDLYRGTTIRSMFYKHCFTRSIQDESRENNQEFTARVQVRNTENLNSFICSMGIQ